MSNNARVILGVANDNWQGLKDLQASMFKQGDIAIKLAFFGLEREGGRRPCITTRWVHDAADMNNLIDKARTKCVCGCYAEISDIFTAALREESPPQSIVIFGAGVSHNRNRGLDDRAEELRAKGIKVFVFHGHRDVRLQALADQTGGKFFEINPAIERVAERVPRLLEAVTQAALGNEQPLRMMLGQKEHVVIGRR
jgi:hypothetical protein